MAVRKTELYSLLWSSCDKLHGGMDASQFKDYVLTLLLMKYGFDKHAGDPYGMIVVSEGDWFRDRVAKLITRRTQRV
jgi:type I restriction enzyme M protein